MRLTTSIAAAVLALGPLGCSGTGSSPHTTTGGTGSGSGTTGAAGGSSGGSTGAVDGGVETLAGLEITVALHLSAPTVALGGTLTATATLFNATSAPITLMQADIAGRPPGGSNNGGPFDDFLDGPSVTIQPQKGYLLNGSRTFASTDPTGQWYAYVSLEDSNGTFHDSTRDVTFTVTAAGGTGTTGAGSTTGAGGSSGGATSSGGSTSGGTVGGGGTMRAGTNNWNLGWGIYANVFSAAGDSATWAALTPPFQPGQTAKASVPWNPTFLQEMAHYDTIRYMDFVNANSNTETDWSTRILPNVSPTDGTNNPNGILAWEWIIDLANRTGTNPWLNIPVEATSGYLSSLATLVFANLTARPGLTVYVEWGNEDWWEPLPNGVAKTLGGGDATKGTVIGSTTMFQAFQTALAASGRTDIKLVRVLGGQCVNTYLTTQLLGDLPSGGADVLAIAPYVGSETTVTSADFASEFQAVVQQVAAQYALTQPAGLGLVGYEGGQNSSSETSANTDDPAYYVPYAEFLQGLSQYMILFNNYMHCNGGTTGGWAAEENVGDVSSSSKAFRVHALFDWNSGYIPASGTVPSTPAAYTTVTLPTVSY
ncbi:MAG TPA: hypothetical protein VMB50_14330 [Myxococcales bacterium]|nr:hypothetical protein [Myxococcales bacterium]